MYKTIARTGLAALVATAATLGAVAAPATAAEPATGTHAVAGNGAGWTDEPQIILSQNTGVFLGPASFVYGFRPVQPGQPVKLNLNLVIGGEKSTYTDVHYRTSNPGTSTGCDMKKIYAKNGNGGNVLCNVTLPAMKPGQTSTYWVTMTGKRDGKPFSVTRSTRLWAAPVRVEVYVAGQRVTGQRVKVAKNSTVDVAYQVNNATTWTLSNVIPAGAPTAKKYATDVAPWGFRDAAMELSGAEVAKHPGGYVLEGVIAGFGTEFGYFAPESRTVLVAE